MGIKDDNLLDDQLQHFGVKFPLPGIEGLMDGEILCFGTQNCAKYTVGLGSSAYALLLYVFIAQMSVRH